MQPTTQFAATDGRRSLIMRYAIAVFFYWMALSLYLPTLPTYVESKSDTLALVGVVLAQYGLWQAIIRFPVGIAADWLGRRKPFIVVGFALAGLGALVMGTASGVEGLGVGRAITGLAAGMWVPLVVVFSALFPPEEAVRASALLAFTRSAGRVLATTVTGSLNAWGGYPLAFFLAAGVAALAILVVLTAGERRRPSQPPSMGGIGRLIVRRDVLFPSLLAAVDQYAYWATTFGFIPILAQQLGATDITQSMMLSMNVGVVTAGNLLTSAISGRISGRRLVVLSFMLQAVGIGVAALAPSLLWLFIAQFCIGLSQGFGHPVLMGMSIRQVAEEQRATAMGLFQAVYGVGMFAGPGLSGVLADAVGIRPTFWVTAFACLVAGLWGGRWLAPDSETLRLGRKQAALATDKHIKDA